MICIVFKPKGSSCHKWNSALYNALQNGLEFLAVELSGYQDALYSRRQCLYGTAREFPATVS